MIFGKKSCLPSDGLGFRQGQDVVHYVCGRKLGLIIQVAVDVCRGADIAVAQPFLDLLHEHVVGKQQRGAAVPEIVEADMPQTFQFQQLAEIAAEIPGIKNVPHYIHEHIAVVFPVVAVAADPLVFLLLLLQGQQLLPDIVDQRKRAQTGFRLGAILADDLILAVYLGITYATTVANIEGRIDADYYSPKFSHFRSQIEALPYRTVSVDDISEKIVSGFAAGKQDQADNLPEDQRVPHLRPFSITPEGELSFETKKYVPKSRLKSEDYCKKNEVIFNNTNSPDLVGKTTVFDSDVLCAASNHMTRITVKEGVNPYYVAAFFNVLLSIGYWKLLCTNFNNQAGVNTDTLKRVKIPLPPKEIQDQIAAELMQRRSQANVLRRQAIKEWADAKAQFEKELLGE